MGDPSSILVVVIGAPSVDGYMRNQRSGLRFMYNTNFLTVNDTPDILSCYESRDFWISWHDGKIEVGQYHQYGRHQLFEAYTYDSNYYIQTVGFATPMGGNGGIWAIRENAGMLHYLCGKK